MLPNSNAYCDKRLLLPLGHRILANSSSSAPTTPSQTPAKPPVCNVAAVCGDVGAVADDSLQVVQLVELQFHARAKMKIKNESWARLAFECTTTDAQMLTMKPNPHPTTHNCGPLTH